MIWVGKSGGGAAIEKEVSYNNIPSKAATVMCPPAAVIPNRTIILQTEP